VPDEEVPMSMNGWFRSVSEKALALLDDDPSLVEVLVRYDPENPAHSFVLDPKMLSTIPPDFT